MHIINNGLLHSQIPGSGAETSKSPGATPLDHGQGDDPAGSDERRDDASGDEVALDLSKDFESEVLIPFISDVNGDEKLSRNYNRVTDGLSVADIG